MALTKAGSSKEALADYNKAVALNSKKADLFTRRSELKIKLKTYADAEKDFARALSLDCRSAAAYFGRGYFRMALKQMAQACADLTKAQQFGNRDAADLLKYNKCSN